MTPMTEAIEMIAKAAASTLSAEIVPISSALGRVAADNVTSPSTHDVVELRYEFWYLQVTAREPLPPFDASIMDG